MHRFIVAFTALVVTLVAAVSPASADARKPTHAELERALVTRSDLGPAFTLTHSQRISDGFTGVLAIYERTTGSVEMLAVGLADTRTGPPDKNARDFVKEVTGGRTSGTEIRAPWLGENTVRYVFAHSVNGRFLYGDVIAWQHEGVVALVALVSEDITASPVSYAERQQQKLVSTFASSGSDRRPRQ